MSSWMKLNKCLNNFIQRYYSVAIVHGNDRKNAHVYSGSQNVFILLSRENNVSTSTLEIGSVQAIPRRQSTLGNGSFIVSTKT